MTQINADNFKNSERIFSLSSAEADIVCVEAVSTADYFSLPSAEADIVCVEAVSIADSYVADSYQEYS